LHNPRIGLEDDYQELVNQNGRLVSSIQKGTDLVGALFGDSSIAVGKMFGSLGSLTNKTFETLSSKPSLATAAIGFGGLYTGVRAIKNFVKTLQSIADPKSSPAVPWIIYGLQSILEGGLTLGLAAPLLNIKNPFAKVINGKEVVQIKTIVGAALAPILMSIYISMAQNSSIINRLPLIGNPLKEIASSVSDGLKHITTNTGEQNAMGQAAPQLPPGIGG
jgi:hypothetical protein